LLQLNATVWETRAHLQAESHWNLQLPGKHLDIFGSQSQVPKLSRNYWTLTTLVNGDYSRGKIRKSRGYRWILLVKFQNIMALATCAAITLEWLPNPHWLIDSPACLTHVVERWRWVWSLFLQLHPTPGKAVQEWRLQRFAQRRSTFLLHYPPKWIMKA
jgi:hypothetical protein